MDRPPQPTRLGTDVVAVKRPEVVSAVVRDHASCCVRLGMASHLADALNAAIDVGVGTGAGEGAPRQDTGSAWVTRSADCPEAPAQAHLHAAAREGERGGADECPACGADAHFCCLYQYDHRERGGAEVAAAVETVARSLCNCVSRGLPRHGPLCPTGMLLAALADPAGALATHAAEVWQAGYDTCADDAGGDRWWAESANPHRIEAQS